MTTPKQRFKRYVRSLSECVEKENPSKCEDYEARNVRRAFVWTLEEIVNHLPDLRLDRLLRLLEYLETQDGAFFSADTTMRLSILPWRELHVLFAEQITRLLADSNASVEELTAGWRRDFASRLAETGQMMNSSRLSCPPAGLND